MSKSYNWRCKVCDASNHYASSACIECQAPKIIRPIEVDAIRAERGGFPIPLEDQQELVRLKKIDGLSTGERALYWLFVIPAIAISMLIKFGFWAVLSAFGFMGFVALAVIGLVSWIVASSLSSPKVRS